MSVPMGGDILEAPTYLELVRRRQCSVCIGSTRSEKMAIRIVSISAGLILLVGCTGAQTRVEPRNQTQPVITGSSRPGRVMMADANRCPVTRPRTVGPPGVSPDEFFGWGASYGNGKLWVGGLWPHGVIVAGKDFVEPDGSVGMKFGWWRKVSGLLSISGRRLDAPAPPAHGVVPSGYGFTGFQASGVSFPTEGCWEVTGKVGKTTLSFVTFVIKRGGA